MISKEKFSIKNFFVQNRHTFFIVAVILFGIFVRIIEFGTLPAGLNQDEAYAGYEAYSILNYGTDSFGYHNPCYFTAWGSGMNVLESYLAIPFIKLFGLSVFSFRLPQLICACISLPVFYLLLKELFDRKHATVGLVVLSVCPWHIMLSRWGLESNLAPAFLLFGFYFFVKGINNNKYFLFSAIMYGTALYSYAITWTVVPVTILLCGVYLLLSKKKIIWKYVLISVGILFILALPLILFVLVNNGYIGEIKTNFFSVPKLLEMRDSEISLKNLIDPESYKAFWDVFHKQNDGLPWNSTGDFGMFYFISIPFMIIGIGKSLGVTWKKIKEKEFSYEIVFLLCTFGSLLSCLMLKNPNINRINCLHFYTLIFITMGIVEANSWFKSGQYFKHAIAVGYVLSFLSFCGTYFGNYNETIGYYFNYGAGECIQYVKSLGCESCSVDSSIFYSQVLFYDQTPVDEFRETVVFTNYPSAYLSVSSFGMYDFGVDYNSLGQYDSYIVKSDDAYYFTEQGYSAETFGNYTVCYME